MNVSDITQSKPASGAAHALAPVGSLSRRLMRRMIWTAMQCRNESYLVYERALARLLPAKRLRILIAENPEWQDKIKEGFQGSRHEVVFAPIEARSSSKFDVVVPLQIPELIQAGQWPEFLAANPFPIPSQESIALCDDKFKFGQALIDKGFGTYVPKMIQGAGLEVPYILKKRISCWGKDCWVIHNRHDEWRVSDKISGPDYYCQQIVPGTSEFATHILFAKGRIIKSLNIKYEFESKIPIKGQDKCLYTVVHRCPYLDLFTQVLQSIDFQGLCCVNYKVLQGRPYILEINPRFGGSLTPYFFSFIRHLQID